MPSLEKLLNRHPRRKIADLCCGLKTGTGSKTRCRRGEKSIARPDDIYLVYDMETGNLMEARPIEHQSAVGSPRHDNRFFPMLEEPHDLASIFSRFCISCRTAVSSRLGRFALVIGSIDQRRFSIVQLVKGVPVHVVQVPAIAHPDQPVPRCIDEPLQSFLEILRLEAACDLFIDDDNLAGSEDLFQGGKERIDRLLR